MIQLVDWDRYKDSRRCIVPNNFEILVIVSIRYPILWSSPTNLRVLVPLPQVPAQEVQSDQLPHVPFTDNSHNPSDAKDQNERFYLDYR